MAKYKLRQFAEVEKFANVYHHVQNQKDVEDFAMKGLWLKQHFKNEHPLVLELGCGKGEYTTAMAQAFKEKNFIGVDIKGNRIWTGAKVALEQNLHNAAFLRSQIEHIVTVFGPQEVDEIWITFPDPQVQEGRIKKRLTSIPFLSRYRQIIKPGGIIHLKTDNSMFYEFTMKLLQDEGHIILLHTNNLYAEVPGFLGAHHDLLFNTRTHYEKKFSAMGYTINYIKFQLKNELL